MTAAPPYMRASHGTSGHQYLRKGAERHRAFGDLFELPTFCIPRSALPRLPAEVAKQLGFRWESPPPASDGAPPGNGERTGETAPRQRS